ncbi:hypothetical protein R6Q59_000128 [Mikania micrantha]
MWISLVFAFWTKQIVPAMIFIVLLRENKIINSSTTPTTPKLTMDPPTSTTGQATPSTPSPNLTTNPTSTFEVPPTNTTPLATTQSEHAFTYNPSSVVPPLSYFFPTSGQSSSTQQIPLNQFQPSSTIVHTTSTFQPSIQSGFHHPTSQFVQSSGIGGDGFEGGYEEEFGGYEEEGYYYEGDGGNLGPQGFAALG